MQHSLKISVLVPFFNAEKTLKRCAESIFKQTFTDFEVLFIDDGSTDNGVSVIEKTVEVFSFRDKAKIIKHEQNKGVAEARNTGIDNASGDYIAFVDADDWIEPDMLAVKYRKAEQENADIVVSDMFMEHWTNSDSICKTEILPDRIEMMKNIITQNNFFTGLPVFLISKKLFLKTGVRFIPGMKYGEDRLVITKLFYFAEKPVKIDQALYHYEYNASSTTHSLSKEHFDSFILMCKHLQVFFDDRGEYDTYKQSFEFAMAQGKADILVTAPTGNFIKQYSTFCREFEMKYIKQYKYLSTKIFVVLSHYRLFLSARLFCFLLRQKWKLARFFPNS